MPLLLTARDLPVNESEMVKNNMGSEWEHVSTFTASGNINTKTVIPIN
jgi:hypothetical protein